MRPLVVRVVDPGEVAGEWGRLATELSSSPFVHPGWVTSWRRAFGRGRPLVLAAYDGPALVGVLPLQRRRGVVTSPTNWHTPEFGLVSRDDLVSERLLATAVGMSRRRFELAFVEESLIQQVDSVAVAAHRPVLSRVLQRSPRLTLETSFTDYLASQSRNMRRTLKRRHRRAEQVGSVSFSLRGDPDHDGLQEFFRIEASGWKGRNGTAISSSSETRTFYTEVAEWAAGMGWLRLASTRVAGRTVAGDLSLLCDGVVYVLKTAADEAAADLSPGVLHHHAAIEQAFAEGLEVYDFTGGSDEWKMHWTRATRDLWLVQVFGRGVAGRLDQFAATHVRPHIKRALGRR